MRYTSHVVVKIKRDNGYEITFLNCRRLFKHKIFYLFAFDSRIIRDLLLLQKEARTMLGNQRNKL